MTEIERLIEDNSASFADGKRLIILKDLAKSIEQYVIKARIEECKRMTPKNWKEVLIAKLGIIMINRRDERIEELKNTLKTKLEKKLK